jgi:hypothetical protein
MRPSKENLASPFPVYNVGEPSPSPSPLVGWSSVAGENKRLAAFLLLQRGGGWWWGWIFSGPVLAGGPTSPAWGAIRSTRSSRGLHTDPGPPQHHPQPQAQPHLSLCFFPFLSERSLVTSLELRECGLLSLSLLVVWPMLGCFSTVGRHCPLFFLFSSSLSNIPIIHNPFMHFFSFSSY